MACFTQVDDSEILPHFAGIGQMLKEVPCDPVEVARHATTHELLVLLSLVASPHDPNASHLASIHPDLFNLTNAAVRIYTGRPLEVCGSDKHRIVVKYPGRSA